MNNSSIKDEIVEILNLRILKYSNILNKLEPDFDYEALDYSIQIIESNPKKFENSKSKFEVWIYLGGKIVSKSKRFDERDLAIENAKNLIKLHMRSTAFKGSMKIVDISLK